MGFFPICDPSKFFSKLTACKRFEKTNERSLKYLETDIRTDGRINRQVRLLRTPSLKPEIQNVLVVDEKLHHFIMANKRGKKLNFHKF